MADTILTLGDFQFGRYEVPEQIGVGGEQQLVVHRLVGGTRVIDSMGIDPRSLEWSGWFAGSTALDRALYLDGLRKAGKALILAWSVFRYTVVIRSFTADFQRFYRLPYRISCEVVSDDTSPIAQFVDPSADQLISDDIAAASSLVDGIGDASLSGLMETFSIAATAIGPPSSVGAATLASLEVPLAAVRGRVSDLLDASGDEINSSPGLDAGIPGGALAAQIQSISGQITAVSTQPDLIALDRTLGRVALNLSSLNAGTKTQTVAGGDLFTIASKQYGDPMGWTAIAAANGLSDPRVEGVKTLQIPPFSNDTGGVLNG